MRGVKRRAFRKGYSECASFLLPKGVFMAGVLFELKAEKAVCEKLRVMAGRLGMTVPALTRAILRRVVLRDGKLVLLDCEGHE